MSLDPDSFRAALGRFASGVTVVTARDTDSTDMGMTVSAFSSLSLTPPLVLVCIDRTATMHELLCTTPHFVVNILASDQEAIARRFADKDAKRFDGIGYERGRRGIAVLDDVLASLECHRVAHHDAGDHTIVIGEVEHANMRDAKPLLYYRGGFAQLER
jgi:flavin reductase (DIM6/NTAB) family NADH-FMN oxidoreductase RutF